MCGRQTALKYTPQVFRILLAQHNGSLVVPYRSPLEIRRLSRILFDTHQAYHTPIVCGGTNKRTTWNECLPPCASIHCRFPQTTDSSPKVIIVRIHLITVRQQQNLPQKAAAARTTRQTDSSSPTNEKVLPPM